MIEKYCNHCRDKRLFIHIVKNHDGYQLRCEECTKCGHGSVMNKTLIDKFGEQKLRKKVF